MKQQKKLEFWVGVFILLGLGTFMYLSLSVANQTWSTQGDTYQLTARFENIGGLKVRSPVKIGGVTVGTVSRIHLEEETYLPIVIMDLDASVGFFPETSTASILTAGLLGEQYIGIEPGFVDEDISLLKQGDRIEDTQSAIVLENLIGQVLYSLQGDK